MAPELRSSVTFKINILTERRQSFAPVFMVWKVGESAHGGSATRDKGAADTIRCRSAACEVYSEINEISVHWKKFFNREGW